MSHELQDVSLTMAKALRSESEKEALYFNTATLSRFMKACYGPDAMKEAQRHVQNYMEIKEPEIAAIWKRVVAHLQGVEIKEDPRRIVKAPKPLNVKTDNS